MFELPEYITIARQMNQSLAGKTVLQGNLGNTPGKFLWYNRSHEEFTQLTSGKTIGAATVRGRWLFVPLDPGYVLVLGECGGKILYHEPGSAVPKKYHLHITFEDDSFLTTMTQMWGAMELYEAGRELEREYIKNMRPTPTDPEFTYDYFDQLVGEVRQERNYSAKALLTQDQLIPGLGNAIAQDILFQAKLHPRHDIGDLESHQRRVFYDAIQQTVNDVVEAGGRYDEVDLYGKPGRYARIMDKNALGYPCPRCGGKVTKIQYLGGSCYLCESCQV